MKNYCYVVTMYRFADKERHSYVLGIYDDEKKARKAADKEQVNRGGNKYWPEILIFEMNSGKATMIHKLGDYAI